MVIPAPSVAGDGQSTWFSLVVDVVVQPNRQQAVGSIQQQGRVFAAGGGHPAHVGLVPGLEPAFEGSGAQSNPGAAWQTRHTHRVEALLPSLRFQGLRESV